MAKRFAPSKTQKEALLKKWPSCYVCGGLGLPDSSFSGYSLANRDIQFDHWLAAGLVGGAQEDLLANLRPIHAATGAPSPKDPGWRGATRRNCHIGKGNAYTGEQWVNVAKIMSSLHGVEFIEDLLPKRSFETEPETYKVSLTFSDDVVKFQGKTLPVQRQSAAGKEWRYVSTMVSPHMLWTDEDAQPRKANPKRLREVAEDLLIHPLLTPVVCRIGADGRILVSDGNHRLCAFYLVRPNDAIPVTIWDVPSVPDLLDVLANAHDKLTQQKYQFTDKALKYSGLGQDELDQAVADYGPLASEKLAWQGMTAPEVQVRVQGKLSENLKAGGFRDRWMTAGLTDASWKFFLGHYCRMTAVDEPFDSPQYHRESELANITKLCEIIDTELVEHILAGTKAGLADSLKTKWWAEAHRQLVGAMATTVRDVLDLPTTPSRLAYTPEWTPKLEARFRSALVNWRESPLWNSDVNRTANNEPDVKKVMLAHDFHEKYLNQ